MSLTDWQQRVLDEYEELGERNKRLCAFINSEPFTKLDIDVQRLMIGQTFAMDHLADILSERIRRFEPRKAFPQCDGEDSYE